MSVSGTFGKRALAVCAAAALGLGGLLVASPASANSQPTELAPTEGAAYEAFAKSLFEQDGVQAVGKDVNGDIVVLTAPAASDNAKSVNPDALESFSKEISATYDNVTTKAISGAAKSFASTDVVGGAGYLTGDEAAGFFSCSVGFNAWDKTGAEAIISAGHCTDDGAFSMTALTLPASDAAGGETERPALTHPLGSFGFSQFGGVGNTYGSQDTDSVDVSVIDVTNGDLSLKPVVTDWTTPGDLSQSTSNVTAVGHVDAAAEVCKSGRTTGFTCATGVTIVDGWMDVGGRLVYGFGNVGLHALPGDSGGSVIQSGTAVGILSGGVEATATEPAFTWAADLQNNLAHTDGYTVKLFIDAPVVTTAAGSDVERGGAIVGTAPAGTTLVVKPATGSSFEVAVDGSGNWTFPAPSTLDEYKFTVTAKSGFNVSASAEGSVNVVLAPLVAPVVTTPANGGQVADEVTELTGTGLPGATVTATGDATGTATVAADGAWKIEFAEPLGYGDYAVSVTQSSEGQKSPAANVAFKVVLAAPVITSPANGSSFDLSAAPKKIEGTGINGATVQVTLSGEALAPVTVVDGKWSAPIDFALIAGDYAVVATQTIDDVVSADAVSGFALTVAPAPVDPGTPSDPAGDGDLANTGFDGLPFLGGAAALLLVGGGALFLMRRRSVTE